MLTLADILNLIRLTEIELDKLQLQMESDDEELSNNSAQIIVQMDKLSQKLQTMYESDRGENSDYPTYENYLKIIKKIPLTKKASVAKKASAAKKATPKKTPAKKAVAKKAPVVKKDVEKKTPTKKASAASTAGDN